MACVRKRRGKWIGPASRHIAATEDKRLLWPTRLRAVRNTAARHRLRDRSRPSSTSAAKRPGIGPEDRDEPQDCHGTVRSSQGTTGASKTGFIGGTAVRITRRLSDPHLELSQE